VLSVAFVGQGLLPDRTLSSSDGLWSTAPWAATKPDGVRPLGANYELADAVAVFQPFFEHMRRVAPDVPLWNSHIMGGRPFLANAQSAVLSPFTMPIHLIGLWKALAVIAALKLFVAAFGTYLLGRTLGTGFAGALLAGVVFAFGTFFVSWLAWPLTNIFPLIPLMLLLTELLVRRPGPLPVAGLAVLVALQFFGGHPETSFHVMVVVVLWFAFRAGLAWWKQPARPRRHRQLTRPVLAFCVAVAGGTALAAAALLPLLELLYLSGDWSRRSQAAPTHSDPAYLGTILLADYWGRPTQTALVPITSNRGYYAGGITLLLAACALVLRPTVTRVAIAAFAVLSLAVALGLQPFFDLLTVLPGFNTAHNGRIVVFVLLALALLAGWGLDDLVRRRPVGLRRRGLALGAAAAIFCAPVVWMLAAGTLAPSRLGPALEIAWGFADAPPVAAGETLERPGSAIATIRLSALLEWLPLAGLGLVLVALRLTGARVRRRWTLSAGVFGALAVAVLVADLFRANMGFNPAIPDDHAQQPTTGAIRYLQARRPNRFAGFDRVQGPVLQPDLAMRYGLYDARGYDYPVERRYDTIWRATVAPPSDLIPPIVRAVASPAGLRTMSLLSVSDLLQNPADPVPRAPGLRLAYSGPDARVYRNGNALPRAFVVDRQRTVADDDAALAAVTAPGFDARRVAVTERPIDGLPQAGRAAATASASASASARAAAARLVRYEDERVVARVSVARRSLLVLTDVHYPGWKATVDGRDAPVDRVDYLLRGIAVPAGAHTVELRYEPLSWRVGWIVSALATLVLAGVVLVALRSARRGS
jgi:membrane protein YfhO